MTMALVYGWIALALVAGAAIHHFGWIDGLGITAAVWTLMPYRYPVQR